MATLSILLCCIFYSSVSCFQFLRIKLILLYQKFCLVSLYVKFVSVLSKPKVPLPWRSSLVNHMLPCMFICVMSFLSISVLRRRIPGIEYDVLSNTCELTCTCLV